MVSLSPHKLFHVCTFLSLFYRGQETCPNLCGLSWEQSSLTLNLTLPLPCCSLIMVVTSETADGRGDLGRQVCGLLAFLLPRRGQQEVFTRPTHPSTTVILFYYGRVILVKFYSLNCDIAWSPGTSWSLVHNPLGLGIQTSPTMGNPILTMEHYPAIKRQELLIQQHR